jgi:hypothetical protein
MSQPELKAVCLAGYNDKVVEIFDQPLLWPSAQLNPLSAFEPDRANLYPEFHGTVDVAERLGYIDLHATISYKKSGKRRIVPWPYQGDLLLFLEDGPEHRCVNWPVKKRRNEFLAPSPGSRKKEKASRLKKRARYEIELVYYKDAGIPTVPIAGEEIDNLLATNLLNLCCYANLKTSLEEEQSAALVEAFAAGIETGTPPAVTMSRLAQLERCTVYDAKIVFYQSIWERKLRVDLFSPILIDRPPIPEYTDVLDHYNDWFTTT